VYALSTAKKKKVTLLNPPTVYPLLEALNECYIVIPLKVFIDGNFVLIVRDVRGEKGRATL
jgi:hypothetical protein